MCTTIQLHMSRGSAPSPDVRYISAEEYEYDCLRHGSTDGTLAGIADAIDRDELAEEFAEKVGERKKREKYFREEWASSQANRKVKVSEFIERMANAEKEDRENYEHGFAKEQEEDRLYYARLLKFEKRRAAKRESEKEEEARAELRRKRIEARQAGSTDSGTAESEVDQESGDDAVDAG